MMTAGRWTVWRVQASSRSHRNTLEQTKKWIRGEKYIVEMHNTTQLVTVSTKHEQAPTGRTRTASVSFMNP